MAVASRTVATAPAKPAPTSQGDLVNLATLVRGRVYYHKDVRFELGKPVVVSNELATILEDLVQEVHDADREVYEKPLFLVQRSVPRPVPVDEKVQRRPTTRLPVRPLRRG